MDNSEPILKEQEEDRIKLDLVDGKLKTITVDSIFELIRDIKDPEHPYSLERLNVVSKDDIIIEDCTSEADADSVEIESNSESNSDGGSSDSDSLMAGNAPHSHDSAVCRNGLPIPRIIVNFTPTVPHCSMAGIIGLCIRYQLERHIEGYWIVIRINEGMHNTYKALNKQFDDKDRVMAAFENVNLIEIIESCLDKY